VKIYGKNEDNMKNEIRLFCKNWLWHCSYKFKLTDSWQVYLGVSIYLKFITVVYCLTKI